MKLMRWRKRRPRGSVDTVVEGTGGVDRDLPGESRVSCGGKLLKDAWFTTGYLSYILLVYKWNTHNPNR
jgi:hypothetical protein